MPANRTFTEISRLVADLAVAESGLYAPADVPAGESYVIVEHVLSVDVVDEIGYKFTFNFAPTGLNLTYNRVFSTEQAAYDASAYNTELTVLEAAQP